MWKKAEKYYQTLKYLKKSQLLYLVKNRLEKGKKAVVSAQAPAVGKLPLWTSGLDEDEDYRRRFALEDLLKGRVRLLHESGEPGGKNWFHPEKSHLWNFNLHYLEFLIPLAAAFREGGERRYYECFRAYCRRWMEDNQEGTGDGWHPYTISLRLTNLWICMDGFGEILQRDGEFLRKLNDSMYAQYRHLQKRLERHLLGNHYLENLKAVMLGGVYFEESGVYEKYSGLFRRELGEQILADGVHYERSPMYHKIVLEDLMRAAKGVREKEEALYQELLKIIQSMADAMYSLEEGMGRTPLFNDSGDNVARSMSSILKALREEFGIAPVPGYAFEQAGYYCLRSGELKLLMDAGEIAPSYMPGHGHCDGLSFELSWRGRPVFVNSGTGQYQGELRSYFRSTAAHNTVVLSGEEQSQCWGEHRVGRRISEVSAQHGERWIRGRLKTCAGRAQERSIRVEGSRAEILDRVSGPASAYLHLAPDYVYEQKEREIWVLDLQGKAVCRLSGMPGDGFRIYKEGRICSYAPEFGRIEHAQVLEISWDEDGAEHKLQLQFL